MVPREGGPTGCVLYRSLYLSLSLSISRYLSLSLFLALSYKPGLWILSTAVLLRRSPMAGVVPRTETGFDRTSNHCYFRAKSQIFKIFYRLLPESQGLKVVYVPCSPAGRWRVLSHEPAASNIHHHTADYNGIS